MSHFYTIHLRKWRRWVVVVVVALFAAVFLWFEHNDTFSVFSTDQPEALTKGNKDEKNIALTFNISWGEKKVHDILQRLKNENVQATFFVSGEWAERHPEIIEKITDEKHELGILGYRYKSYLEQEPEQVKKDLLRAQEVFEELGHDDIDLVRPPDGEFDKNTIELVENLGFNMIHWSVNPNDWKNPGEKKITDFIMEETYNGDILLMHASDSVKQTEKSLKTVLPGLKNKEYHFVPVSEFINQAHTESEPIK